MVVDAATVTSATSVARKVIGTVKVSATATTIEMATGTTTGTETAKTIAKTIARAIAVRIEKDPVMADATTQNLRVPAVNETPSAAETGIAIGTEVLEVRLMEKRMRPANAHVVSVTKVVLSDHVIAKVRVSLK